MGTISAFAYRHRETKKNQHFPQYVCSAQYGCFLQSLHFVLCRHVAQVLSEWFWDGSSRPFTTGITLVFISDMCCTSILRSLDVTNFAASFLITFLSPQIANIAIMITIIMTTSLLPLARTSVVQLIHINFIVLFFLLSPGLLHVLYVIHKLNFIMLSSRLSVTHTTCFFF